MDRSGSANVSWAGRESAESEMAGRTASRILRVSLAWLCAIAIGSMAGEVATRLTGAIDGVSIIPRRLLTGTDAPLLPYRLRQGVGLTSQGVPVRVNRFGLRGAEIARKPGNERSPDPGARGLGALRLGARGSRHLSRPAPACSAM